MKYEILNTNNKIVGWFARLDFGKSTQLNKRTGGGYTASSSSLMLGETY